jgi:isoquinoline 1-oxidoreductase beta subunit
MDTLKNPSRRNFLKGSAALAGGLIIGFHIPEQGRAAQAAAASGEPFAPNAFLRIAGDGSVTVILKHAEMGQGVATSLPMLIAEDLEADWEKIGFEFSPVAPDYNHTVFGIMLTGGSTSIANSYEQMRMAGASARIMLTEAAADIWGVDADACIARQGRVHHGDKSLGYGELADKAAEVPPPAEISLKPKGEWNLLGKPIPRLDTPAKTNGSTTFGLDVYPEGVLTAVVARPPMFGGKVKSFDPAGAQRIKGVVKVAQIPSGVVVIARDFWAAQKGRKALQVEWQAGPDSDISSSGLEKMFREKSSEAGNVAKQAGDVEEALKQADKSVEAEYLVPYLAHAPMEPLNAVVRLSGDSCEIWTGTQSQTLDQKAAAEVAGLKPEQVSIHTQMLGGGFGRRASKTNDFVREAVAVAKALGKDTPVKTFWDRSDDIRGGYYRPMYLHKVRIGVDAAGQPSAWHHRVVGQQIMKGGPFESVMIKDGVDATSVEGIADLPYAPANFLVEDQPVELPVTTLWWRSVGHSHTAFVTETMADEMAELAGQDPVAYRRGYLKEHPRLLGVMEQALKDAGWDKPLEQKEGVRRGRGLAVHKSFSSYCAEVAEVSVQPDGSFKVDQVYCAIDCGKIVNPDTIKAQMEGAIAYGLAPILKSRLTLQNGQVQESNFHDYEVLRMQEMPKVAVSIIDSDEKATGVGEPGLPPLAPAVCNALYAATGERVRTLPVDTGKLAS